jgi:hypothetical protein
MMLSVLTIPLLFITSLISMNAVTTNKAYLGDTEVTKMYQGTELKYTKSNPWTLVMIPDTQKLFGETCIANGNPDGEEIFRQMGEYIADQKTVRNIKQVMHVGDVVNNGGGASQYAMAAAGIDEILDAEIPLTICPGNWDYASGAQSSTRGLSGFNSFFPLSTISGESWFGGSYDSGSENTYTIQTIEGEKWMFLSVEFYPRTEVMTWMNNVIASEAPDYCVVATHAYLAAGAWVNPPVAVETFWDGILLYDGHQYGPNAYGSAFTTDGQDLYDTVISQNDCIILVISGHVLDGRYDPNDLISGTNNSVAHSGRQFTHANGNVCTEIVYNHQNDSTQACNYGNGNNGTTPTLHFFEVNPANKTITVTGYDPVQDVDPATLGNYPTLRPDWEGRHNVTFNY